MPQAELTPAFCEDVRPVEGRQVSYLDKDAKGLELRVSGDGRKSWSSVIAHEKDARRA